jgi:NAD-dependent SIR2 family protein deacetylase
MAGTVIFLGAGATKASGGPMTNEILPEILGNSTQAQSSPVLSDFLENVFHVKPGSPPEQFPGLPLVMSLLDTALDRRQAFHEQWDAQRVSEVRQAIEFQIFDLLEEKLQIAPTQSHWGLLQAVYPSPLDPCIITTNYDLLIDTAMMFASEARTPGGALPDYRIRMHTPFGSAEDKRFGAVLKLHGSLNWLYCRTCQRVELGASDSKKYIAVLGRLANRSLEQAFTVDGNPCPVCKTRLRPLLIAPTHLKDYRNPHLSQVWYEAERVLRQAERAIFIGYSLPDDDVEVIYLLKRGLAHVKPENITVVEYDPAKPPLLSHAVGRRYRTLFGDGLDWHPEGLGEWLLHVQASTVSG